MRRTALLTCLAILVSGCVMPLEVPTPSPTPGFTATPLPTVSPTSKPSVAATPGPDDVPRFTPGSLAVTNAPGLRVRSRPGTASAVLETLGAGAELLIGLGPIMIDGLGWYLVRDADDADPEFNEGWVAAGFEPDPFLVSGGFGTDDNPYLGGFAGTESGEFGPVTIPERRVAFRWIAATDDEEVCDFAVDLGEGSREPVRAVRTPVGTFPASGELPPDYFRANAELAGNVFVLVQSNCAWAVSFVEVPRRRRS
jgi:hypothetical protein